MQKTLERVPVDQLGFGVNFRLPNLYNLVGLQTDISQHDLQEPLMVRDNGNGDQKEILRGNRRGRAILNIREDNPDRFAELFGGGVECIVVSDVSDEEALILKVDEGTKQPLTHPYEIQLAANMLFDAGLAEADVAVQLSDLIDKISPMKAAARKELEALQVKRVDAEKQGLKDYVKTVDTEIREFTGKYRRGFCQNLNNTYRCPDKVKHALFFHACGERHSLDTTDEYLPKLTQSQVTSLWKAHKKDLDIVDEGKTVSKYNKRVTGPNFNKRWAELIAKSKEADSKEPSETKPKAMSAKDMLAEVSDGKFKSDVAILACKWHAGNKEAINDLISADEQAYAANLVRDGEPDLWKKVVKAASRIEKSIAAEADKEATPSEE